MIENMSPTFMIYIIWAHLLELLYISLTFDNPKMGLTFRNYNLRLTFITIRIWGSPLKITIKKLKIIVHGDQPRNYNIRSTIKNAHVITIWTSTLGI